MNDPVDSPCIGICNLDETGEWCTGCGRLRDELFNWQEKPAAERAEIIRKARQRLQRHPVN